MKSLKFLLEKLKLEPNKKFKKSDNARGDKDDRPGEEKKFGEEEGMV